MKAKGFRAWPIRNIQNGGQQKSRDPFNKAKKGGAGYGTYDEYKEHGSEYYSYPSMLDTTAEEYQKKHDERRRNKRDSKELRQRVLRQVVGLAAGSVIIVTQYQAQVAAREEKLRQQAEREPTEAVVDNGTEVPGGETESTSWNWSEDGKTAYLVVTDLEGNPIGEFPATITTSEDPPAGCTTEGRLVYTAAAEASGISYSDSRYEELPALGHAFDEGTEVVFDDGQTGMDFECTRCHEHFVIRNSFTEN